MTRAKDISKILTDADISGTLDVSGAFTSQGIDDNADAVAITITSGENVGIGVVPETTWNSNIDALQLGLGASIYGDNTATGLQISANTVATLGSSTNGYKYIGSDKASTYQQYDGQHNFRVATSGSADGAITWNTALTIDNSGRLLLGTTTEGNVSADNLTVSGDGNVGMTIRSTNSSETAIYFSDGTSSISEYRGFILYKHADDSLRFGSNGTDAFRVLSNNDIAINSTTTSTSGLSSAHLKVGTNASKNSIIVESNRQNQVAYGIHADGSTGIRYAMYILNGGGGEVGKISYTSTAVTYATTSDHRVKESITYDFDATTRLKQLKPCRFNFISDETNTLVDGFLAHEAQAVVPECVTGTHNEVDADGNAVMQGIDQSKIVPLLTKTILELEARITALEGA